MPMIPRSLQTGVLSTCLLATAALAQSSAPQHQAPSSTTALPAANGSPQSPAPPMELSPKAAYQQAMRPFDRTRASIGNWSDIETAALTAAMAQARQDCDARDTSRFQGDDLIDLARLCTLGREFDHTVTAVTLYLAADGPKPRLKLAYAELVDAQLHLKQEPQALAAMQEMLAKVPYDALTAETTDEAIEYMQFVHTDDALAVDAAREPLLLAKMQAAATAPQEKDEDGNPPMSIHELYAEGIDYVALQMLAHASADDTVKALDAALPKTIGPDDAIPIALMRKRIALIGKPLPIIVPTKFLSSPGNLPDIPATNAVTGLLLFPDWCAQCITMGPKLPQTVFTVEGHEAYLYGLLAATVPQNPLPGPNVSAVETFQQQKFDPANASNLLQETPTAVVHADLLDKFAATDVPFLILTDARGIVRVIQPVNPDALIPGGTIDSAIARVSERWPPPSLKETKAPVARMRSDK